MSHKPSTCWHYSTEGSACSMRMGSLALCWKSKASDCSVHLGSGLDSRGILQFDFVEVASFALFLME